MCWPTVLVGAGSMTDDFYMIAITALLPLTAGLLVVQVNPYHALVIRGILGAIAALVYVLFGAADVALTEALVGTMLSITLYAIAVRSSMTVRVGIVEDTDKLTDSAPDTSKLDQLDSQQLLSAIGPALNKYHVRLELLNYPDPLALSTALAEKEIHIAYSTSAALQTRIQRLYDILKTGLPPAFNLSYLEPATTYQPERQLVSTPQTDRNKINGNKLNKSKKNRSTINRDQS